MTVAQENLLLAIGEALAGNFHTPGPSGERIIEAMAAVRADKDAQNNPAPRDD